MTRFLKVLAGAVALSALASASAYAGGNVTMCGPDVAGGTQGPRTYGGTLTQVPSGTIYVFNSSGCAPIAGADVGYFQSQGYTIAAPFGSSTVVTGALPASGTTGVKVGTIPPNSYIQEIVVTETAGNIVTGGVTFGLTSGGTEIASVATTVGASTTQMLAPTNILKTAVSAAGSAIYANPVTSSNAANLTVTVIYGTY